MIGGFVFVSYPAVNGNSGAMTFMINQDALLLQKDLRKTTAETATEMSEFDPDADGALWSNDQFPSFAPAEANRSGWRALVARADLSDCGATFADQASCQ